MNFKQQYLHPKWQKKRLEILSRDNWTCQNCQDNESTLHVHHKEYIKGRKVWEYDNYNFITLCEECHRIGHEIDNHNKKYNDVLKSIRNYSENNNIIRKDRVVRNINIRYCLDRLKKLNGGNHV